MKVEDLLVALSQKLQLETLELDKQGICRFTVNEGTTLTVERSLDEGHFFLFAPIGLMPPRLKEQCAIQKKLLAGNLFSQGTGHASLGFDPESNLIILFQEFEEAYIDSEVCIREFELFLGFLQFWRGELDSIQTESLKGVHRLDDPDINYVSRKDINLLIV